MRLFRRDLHSLAGPYALDALDADERDRFERHLRRCGGCQDEVRRMSQAAIALAMAVAAEPPAGLKERVLAAVAVTPQLPPQTAPDQAREQAIAAVLAAPDVRVASAPAAGGGTATVVVSRTEGKIIVTTAGLRALPAGKVYELWLIGPGTARPAGLLPAPSAGKTAPVLAAGLEAADKVGVTVEPSGGTSSPTTTPILVMPLPE